jgi:ariadne-1
MERFDADAGRARVVAAFRSLDKNGDGLIPKDDLIRVLSKLDKQWTECMTQSLFSALVLDEDGCIATEDFAEWVFESCECLEVLCNGLEKLECQPYARDESELFPVLQEWLKERPQTMARFVCEEVDEGRIILEIWGVEIIVSLRKGGAAGFFLHSPSDDPKVLAALNDMNGMNEAVSLPELLSLIDETLAEKLLQESSALLHSAVESVESMETVCACADHVNAPAPKALLREQSAVVLDLDRLLKVQDSLIDHLSTEIKQDFWTTAQLLRHVGWDDGNLVERLDCAMDSLLEQAGVKATTSEQPDSVPTCLVCFADQADQCLPCGHGLCGDCWPSFLKCNLDSGTVGGDNCLNLKCPGERCPLLVPGKIFQRFLEPEDYCRYRRLWTLSFVNDNSAIVWCPRTGCDLCVGYTQKKSTVNCACGYTFCFSCLGDAPHEPASCSMAKEWKEGLEQHLSKSEKAAQHTKGVKPCPNPDCGVATYKDDGCHWLRCPQCKEFWCWQCGHWGGGPSNRPEPHHVDLCNDPVNEEWFRKARATFALTSEEQTACFRWYYQRHVNHLDSLKFADKLRIIVDEFISDMEHGKHDDDKQLIKQAAEVLIDSRSKLAWSYVWSFSESQAKRDTSYFDECQNRVEVGTEKLSQMIEGQPPLSGMSWLFVALRTDKELTRMVAGGTDRNHDVQRDDLVHHLEELIRDLEEMNSCVSKALQDNVSAQHGGAAALPKAKAKARAKAKPRAANRLVRRVRH